MRLDAFVAAQGHELQSARALILSGQVLVNEAVESRVGRNLREKDVVRIRAPELLRGTRKIVPVLVELLGRLPGGLADQVCLDIGAAHGGFSQALLDHGAQKVYAIDVSYGQLAYHLRQDPRLRIRERKNISQIQADWFEPEDLRADWFMVCDVSFMSLSTVLAALVHLRAGLEQPGQWQGLFLLKPQFEASAATQKGLLLDPVVLSGIQDGFQAALKTRAIELSGVFPAGIPGKKGNQEYFYYLRWQGRPNS